LFYSARQPPRSSPFPYTTLFRSGMRLRDAETEEGKRRLDQDRRADLGRGEHDERRERVRQHVDERDARLAHTDRARGLHERHLRSEEHTSELQSLTNLVCRLLLE